MCVYKLYLESTKHTKIENTTIEGLLRYYNEKRFTACWMTLGIFIFTTIVTQVHTPFHTAAHSRLRQNRSYVWSFCLCFLSVLPVAWQPGRNRRKFAAMILIRQMLLTYSFKYIQPNRMPHATNGNVSIAIIVEGKKKVEHETMK